MFVWTVLVEHSEPECDGGAIVETGLVTQNATTRNRTRRTATQTGAAGIAHLSEYCQRAPLFLRTDKNVSASRWVFLTKLSSTTLRFKLTHGLGVGIFWKIRGSGLGQTLER